MVADRAAQLGGMGARLRDARLRRSLSLRQLATELGVSASLISQVESGKTQPSVSTLWALVTRLGVNIDEVLGGGGRTPDPVVGTVAPFAAEVQRRADNPVLEMQNGVRWERLAGGSGATDAVLVTYLPGASSSIEGKLMRHAGVEYAYMIEGALTLQLDFDTYELRAGDSLHFDSVRPHLFTNAGTDIARGVWFVLGRRQQNSHMPDAPERSRPSGSLDSAVDVLRAIDEL